MKKIGLVLIIASSLLYFGTKLNSKENNNFFSDIPPRASVFGKYSNLKQKLFCYKVVRKYRMYYTFYNFHDIGLHKKPKRYCGKKLQPGYIVYYADTWYVWGKKTGKKISSKTLSTMNDRYSGLVQKDYCANENTFGSVYEKGYNAYVSMGCSQSRRQIGFVVYAKPYKYIWKRMHFSQKNIPLKTHRDGKYTELLQSFRCDRDASYYSNSTELEYKGRHLSTKPTYCKIKSIPGYYVYQAPHWYVWKNKIRE
jgi:hypothetical protein